MLNNVLFLSLFWVGRVKKFLGPALQLGLARGLIVAASSMLNNVLTLTFFWVMSGINNISGAIATARTAVALRPEIVFNYPNAT